MTRVSVAEMYDDKDVITQICKLKDTVNGYAGGIIDDIEISGNDLVIEWADGTSITLPLPDPVTGISSVGGSVDNGNLTITFYFTNGTTHSFTCPLSGMASEAYVDTGLATKADASDVYTKTEIDNALAGYATTTYVDGKRVVHAIVDVAALKTALAAMSIGDELLIGSLGPNWGSYITRCDLVYLYSSTLDGMVFNNSGNIAGANNYMISSLTYKNEIITAEYIDSGTISTMTIDLNATIGAFDRLSWIEHT